MNIRKLVSYALGLTLKKKKKGKLPSISLKNKNYVYKKLYKKKNRK